MKQSLILVSLVAALSAGGAWAQDDTGTEEGAPAVQTPPGGTLDLGEGSDDTGPEPYIKETYEDWALQCLPVSEENEVCQMYQLLQDAGGASVAEASIFKLENGGQAVAGGTFIVPLETLLTEKLTITVDGGQPRRYDFSFCAPIGCYARVGFTEADVNRFRAGAVARVSIVPALAPDQRVTVDMSLSGFTAAFENVTPLRP